MNKTKNTGKNNFKCEKCGCEYQSDNKRERCPKCGEMNECNC